MVPMGPLSILAFCSAIFTSVQAFSLPPALNLLSGASGIKSLVNGTSSNSTNLGARRVFCHASLYGAKLDSTSCRNAWEKMPRSRKEEVFKPRRQGVLYDDATLPIRYLSDDGGCAIDVRFTITRDEQYQRITSNFLTISELAKDLLARCVYTSRSGGEASSEAPIPYVGLDVVVRSYYDKPQDIPVVCSSDPSKAPAQASCDLALLDMPYDLKNTQFSRKPPADVLLPHSFCPPLWEPQQCQLLVDYDFGGAQQDDKKLKARWYHIWLAANAVNTMCVQQGKSGTFTFTNPDAWGLSVTLLK